MERGEKESLTEGQIGREEREREVEGEREREER